MADPYAITPNVPGGGWWLVAPNWNLTVGWDVACSNLSQNLAALIQSRCMTMARTVVGDWPGNYLSVAQAALDQIADTLLTRISQSPGQGIARLGRGSNTVYILGPVTGVNGPSVIDSFSPSDLMSVIDWKLLAQAFGGAAPSGTTSGFLSPGGGATDA